MKKLFFISIAFFAISCSKEQIESNLNSELEISKVETFKEITYKGFTAAIPESFPVEVGSFNANDLENISNQPNSKNLRGTQSNSFDDIIEKVRKRYPDILNFDPKDYKKYFPKLSINEIQKEQEMVLTFVESLMGYEIAVEYSKLSNKNLRVAFEPNSCEKWFYAGHLRLDRDGLETAANKSFEYAGYGYKDKSDANRHAVWNVYLGKNGAYRYSTVDRVKEVVKGLTDAHECNTSDDLDKAMDLHNNDVGIQYLGTIAERYHAGFLNYSTQVLTSDQDIYNYVNNLNTVTKTTVSEINAQNNTTLVKTL